MPQTFWQKVLFTSIMASLMVYVMSVYNMILRTDSFSVGLLVPSAKRYFSELAVALPLALFLAGKMAPKLVFLMFRPQTHPLLLNVFITLIISLIMVPLMSLFVYLYRVGTVGFNPAFYKQMITFNFILAFPVQVLVLGPLVRRLFIRLMALYNNGILAPVWLGVISGNLRAQTAVRTLLIAEGVLVLCFCLI